MLLLVWKCRFCLHIFNLSLVRLVKFYAIFICYVFSCLCDFFCIVCLHWNTLFINVVCSRSAFVPSMFVYVFQLMLPFFSFFSSFILKSNAFVLFLSDKILMPFRSLLIQYCKKLLHDTEYVRFLWLGNVACFPGFIFCLWCLWNDSSSVYQQ